jgi:hypothetical protein
LVCRDHGDGCPRFGAEPNASTAPWRLRYRRGLWFLDLLLFVLFTVLYAARWIFFFDGARQILWHSVVSMFLGAIPMGLATIINGLLVFGLPLWGKSAVSVAHTLWWADAAMSVASGLFGPIPHVYDPGPQHGEDDGYLAAVHRGSRGCGGQWRFTRSAPLRLGGRYGIDPLLCPLGVFRPLGNEHTRHPAATPRVVQVTECGHGRFRMAGGWSTRDGRARAATPRRRCTGRLRCRRTFGRGRGRLQPGHNWRHDLVGLWRLVASARDTEDRALFQKGMPFNLGWWGFIFPLSINSLATLALGRATHLGFFSFVGGILVICLTAIWFIVALLTVGAAWNGSVFPQTPRSRLLRN